MRSQTFQKIRSRRSRQARRQQLAFRVIAIMAAPVFVSNAVGGSDIPPEYRISAASDKFDDTWQVAVAFALPAPKRLRARYIDLTVGSISTSTSSEAFVAIGPVWRLPVRHSRIYVDLGFSPTLLSGSIFNDRDLGGKLHFTSSATFGATFGKNDWLAVALRVQHVSNAGLKGSNPGMDVVGLSFGHTFGKH